MSNTTVPVVSSEGDGEEFVPYDIDAVEPADVMENITRLETVRDSLESFRGQPLEPSTVDFLKIISENVQNKTGTLISLEDVKENSPLGIVGAIASVNASIEQLWRMLPDYSPESIEAVEPTIAQSMDVVTRAVQLDDDYRWGWWCNLVMSAIDAGASREVAENAAERFMGVLFKIDMAKDPQLIEDRLGRYKAMVESH